jgi:hypothetical protein
MTDAKTWVDRVAAWRASGLSAVKFCEGQDFGAAGLWRWASKLSSAERKGAAGGSDQAKASQVRLARLVRVSAGGETRPSVGSLAVEMHGFRVVVSPGFDRATLSGLLDEIEARGRRARNE